MHYKTIVSAEILNSNLNNPGWIVVDCRFSLTNPESGFGAYRQGHLPNARFADLEKDLSGPVNGYKGRHPMPGLTQLLKRISEWGINNNSQVVIYDDMGGAFAGRLWWLMRCLGHYQVAVLNGGLIHWQKLGYPLTTELPKCKPTVFRAYPGDESSLSAAAIENGLAMRDICLIDARTKDRYEGKNEPIDAVAGHVPGAINRPFQQNLRSDGLFAMPENLKADFEKLIGNISTEKVVHMCGSGVTACHNLLAMEIAGLTGSKIYPGSWSEWIRNKNRAVIIN